MTLSRRSTIKAIGVVGGGSALGGTALAVNEHEDDERDPEEESDGEVGAIRVGHFSPDAPNVDVYVDGQQILTDVAYGELSPYLEIVPGTYTLTITAAGDDEPIYEDTLPVDTDYYTAAAIGELEAGEPGVDDAPDVPDDEPDVDDGGNETETASSIQDNETDDDVGFDDAEQDEPGTGTFEVLLLFDEGPEYIEEAGTSQLRLVHASPDAPTIDVAEADQGLSLFEDVSFTQPSGYTPVEPGTQTLEIFEAGENDFAEVEDEPEGDDLDNETEQPETASSIQDNETDDAATNETAEDDGLDEVIDQTEPVASVEVDLEEDTSYTAFAIGYLAGEDDRPFEVRVAIDGEEEEDDLDEEPDEEEIDDEAEPDEEEIDDGGDDRDEYDDDEYDDDEHEDGNYSDEEEEPVTADD